MIKLLTKFWPTLIPLLLFAAAWVHLRKKQQQSLRAPLSALETRLWYGALIASLLITAGTMVYFALNIEPTGSGIYTPAHMENGHLIAPSTKP